MPFLFPLIAVCSGESEGRTLGESCFFIPRMKMDPLDPSGGWVPLIGTERWQVTLKEGLWLVLGDGIDVLSKPHSVRMKRLTLSHSRSNQKEVTDRICVHYIIPLVKLQVTLVRCQTSIS